MCRRDGVLNALKTKVVHELPKDRVTWGKCATVLVFLVPVIVGVVVATSLRQQTITVSVTQSEYSEGCALNNQLIVPETNDAKAFTFGQSSIFSPADCQPVPQPRVRARISPSSAVYSRYLVPLQLWTSHVVA